MRFRSLLFVHQTGGNQSDHKSSRHCIQQSSKVLVAYDHFPSSSQLRALYEWQPLLDAVSFIVHFANLRKATTASSTPSVADSAGIANDSTHDDRIRQPVPFPPLYRSADPLGALYTNYFAPGDQLGWHYDRSEFFVNLILQQPQQGGGVFQFVKDLPPLPTTATEMQASVHEREVMAALNGTSTRITSTELLEGDLILFMGRYSMHRVTPVLPASAVASTLAEQSRINAIFTYGQDPNMTLNRYTRLKFFGRDVALS